MSEPDTNIMRATYATAATYRQSPDPERAAAFDRWLADVKSAARREGWRECARAIQDGLGAWDALEHYGQEGDQ